MQAEEELQWVDCDSIDCLPDELLERILLFVAGSVTTTREALDFIRSCNLVGRRWHELTMQLEVLESALARGGFHQFRQRWNGTREERELSWALVREGPHNVASRRTTRVNAGELEVGDVLHIGPKFAQVDLGNFRTYARVSFTRLQRGVKPVGYLEYEGVVDFAGIMTDSEYFYARRKGQAKANSAKYLSVHVPGGRGARIASARCRLVRTWFSPMWRALRRKYFTRDELWL